LVPDEIWSSVKLIFDMALGGATHYFVQKELKRRGIPSPTGMPEWDRSTISHLVKNPAYAGKFYALKRENCEPKKRVASTYGKTSTHLGQQVYLPEIEVMDAPITWEQHERILDRRAKNKELAQRNAKYNYLLRGFIHCETHLGKRGEPRHYSGRPNNITWDYLCPVGGCRHPTLDGSALEADAKAATTSLLNMERDKFYEVISNSHNVEQVRQSLEKELKGLHAKLNRNINAEVELENRNLMGQEHEQVYSRLRIRYETERRWVEERQEAIRSELAQLGRQDEAATALEQIRERFIGRLEELTSEEWRDLWVVLNMGIHVGDHDNLMDTYWPDHWWQNAGSPGVLITFGLPLPKAEDIGNIVSKLPGNV
jgi:hypothetical protein